MSISLFKPKHTLLSVSQNIQEGLGNNTVFLTDNELIAAGYEIHGLVNIPYRHAMVYCNISIILLVMILLKIYDVSNYFHELVYVIIIVVDLGITLLMRPLRGRLIIKKAED